MAKPWADKPFELLIVPGQPGGQTCSNPDVVAVAVEMAAVHNMIIRGLNSIYLQAPHIHQPADIADLLLYISSWGSVVHHHHALEESLFFPVIDELAKDVGVEESLMNANIDQHHLFEPKFEETLAWVKEVKEGRLEFDTKVLLELIDGFAPVLTQHLHDEIDTLMKLEKLDGAKVKKALDAVAQAGAKTADPYLEIPLLMGTIDKKYPGTEAFPPLPSWLIWMNVYWFTRRHKGCWRFNPSDHWGKPKPLHFL